MTPRQAAIWQAYHQASEMLANATDDLIRAHECRRAGMLCNCDRFEEMAKIRLAAYRKARADYEAM